MSIIWFFFFGSRVLVICFLMSFGLTWRIGVSWLVVGFLWKFRLWVRVFRIFVLFLILNWRLNWRILWFIFFLVIRYFLRMFFFRKRGVVFLIGTLMLGSCRICCRFIRWRVFSILRIVFGWSCRILKTLCKGSRTFLVVLSFT